MKEKEEKRHGPPPEILNAPTKEEALEKIFSVWTPVPGKETIPLTDALGRILAEDVRAKYNIPMVRASAMDGVAIAYDSIREGIPDTTQWKLGRDFVRADTGDDFPDQYDTVVQIEQVTILPEGGLRFQEGIEITPGQNVRPCGSTVREGKLLVRAGTCLGVMDLAAIGNGGYDTVEVMRKPRVAFLPTGSELVPIGSALERGQNFETNSLVTGCLLEEMGAEPNLRPLIPDDYQTLKEQILSLCKDNDLVIVNAGTSKGSEDFCPQVLDEIGEIIFHGVRAVPGRPMCAALCQGTLVINLSGPSLAAFYGLEWMIRPLVARMLGVNPATGATVTATLEKPLHAPGFMSACMKIALTPDGKGGFRAAPSGGGRPGHGSPEPDDLDAPETTDAVYFTHYGETQREAGENIEVLLVRRLEEKTASGEGNPD